MTVRSPLASEWDVEFWQHAKEGHLVIQVCGACQHDYFPPQLMCNNCGADSLDWRKISRLGTVYSYTWIRRQIHPEFPDVPYAVALIEPSDAAGVRIPARFVGMDIKVLTIGAAAELDFDAGGDGTPFRVLFRVVTETQAGV